MSGKPRAANAETIGTVGVDCPRDGCTDKIECTLHTEPTTPKPGAKSATVRLTISDLADKMAAHYSDKHSLTLS